MRTQDEVAPKKKERKITPRANQAVLEQRKSVVNEMMLKGYTSGEIIRFGSDLWKITTRQVEEYISQVNADYKKQGNIDRIDELKKAIERLKLFLKLCEQKGDMRSAIQATKQLHELMYLQDVQKEIIEADNPSKTTRIDLWVNLGK